MKVLLFLFLLLNSPDDDGHCAFGESCPNCFLPAETKAALVAITEREGEGEGEGESIQSATSIYGNLHAPGCGLERT